MVKLAVIAPFAVATVAAVAEASQAGHNTRSYTELVCATVKGSGNAVNPLPTRTSTATVHATVPIVVKVTKATTTVTPPATTATSTSTATVTAVSTNSAVTDTLTVVSTPTVFTTVTDTATVTTTADGGTTTTTVTTSNLVPTNAGYTPLASQIAAAGQTPAQKRQAALPTPNAGAGSLLARGGSRKSSPGFCDKNGKQLANKSVKCEKIVEVVTYLPETVTIGKPKTVTAAGKTSTATVTTTATATSTVAPPDVSVTVTEVGAPVTSTATTATTVTTTVTSTTTATATATAPGYAACAADNLIGHINGLAVTGGTGNYNQASSSQATKEECCAVCQNTTNCIFFAYGAASTTCLTFTPTNNVCPSRYNLYTGNVDASSAFIIGNGVCAGYTTGSV